MCVIYKLLAFNAIYVVLYVIIDLIVTLKNLLLLALKVLTVFLPDVGHRCIESLFQHIEEIAFVQKEIWMEFADTVWQYLSYNVNQIFKIASKCAGRLNKITHLKLTFIC